ncbi:hypothetical protein TNCV_590241 [Trichonephila clavipes]|nr:hypothetical protein TNCV_590241 [Trichonephila clavipes]
MGWTKSHCLYFDRIRLTRHIGASKTAGRTAKESWRKKREKEKRVDLTVSSKKKKTQLSTSAKNSAAAPENSTTVPENSDVVPEEIFLPPKERQRVLFKKHIKLLIFPITIVHWGYKSFYS